MLKTKQTQKLMPAYQIEAVLSFDIKLALSAYNKHTNASFGVLEHDFIFNFFYKNYKDKAQLELVYVETAVKAEFDTFTVSEVSALMEITITIYYFWLPIIQVSIIWNLLLSRLVVFNNEQLSGGVIRGKERNSFKECTAAFNKLRSVLLPIWGDQIPEDTWIGLGLLTSFIVSSFLKQSAFATKGNWQIKLSTTKPSYKKTQPSWVLEKEVIFALNKLTTSFIAISNYMIGDTDSSWIVDADIRLRYLSRLLIFLTPHIEKTPNSTPASSTTTADNGANVNKYKRAPRCSKNEHTAPVTISEKFSTRLHNKVEVIADRDTTVISKKLNYSTSNSKSTTKITSVKFLALLDLNHKVDVSSWSNTGVHLIPGHVIKLGNLQLLGYAHYSSYTELFLLNSANDSRFILPEDNAYNCKWKMPLYFDSEYVLLTSTLVSKIIIDLLIEIPVKSQTVFLKKIISSGIVNGSDYDRILADCGKWSTKYSRLLSLHTDKQKSARSKIQTAPTFLENEKMKKDHYFIKNLQHSCSKATLLLQKVSDYQAYYTMLNLAIGYKSPIFFSVAYDFRGREYSIGTAGWTNSKLSRYFWHYGNYTKEEIDAASDKYNKARETAQIKPLIATNRFQQFCGNIGIDYILLPEALKYGILWTLIAIGRQAKSKFGKEVNINTFIDYGMNLIEEILSKTTVSAKINSLSDKQLIDATLLTGKQLENEDLYELVYCLLILKSMSNLDYSAFFMLKRIIWKDATASVNQQMLLYLYAKKKFSYNICNITSKKLTWYDTYQFIIENFFKQKLVIKKNYSEACVFFFKRKYLKQVIMTKFYGSTPWTDKLNFYTSISDIFFKQHNVVFNTSNSTLVKEIKECFNDFILYLTTVNETLIYQQESNIIVDWYISLCLNNSENKLSAFDKKQIDNYYTSSKIGNCRWVVLADNTYVNYVYLKMKKRRMDLRVQRMIKKFKVNTTRSSQEYFSVSDTLDLKTISSSIRANMIHSTDALAARRTQLELAYLIMVVHDCFAVDVANVNNLIISINKIMKQPPLKSKRKFKGLMYVKHLFLKSNLKLFSWFIVL